MNTKRVGVLIQIVAALFILSPLSLAQEGDLFEKDGNSWLLDFGEFGKGMKIGMMQGLIMGTSLINYEIEPQLKMALKNKSLSAFQRIGLELMLTKLNDLSLFGISGGQIRDGIDSLYKDFSNRRIKIIDAFFVVKMQIEGKDPDLIQAQLRYLRMHPINNKASEEAFKKINDLLDLRIKKDLDANFTNEDLQNGVITEQELLICGTFVDKNNVNHNLFCYGTYK